MSGAFTQRRLAILDAIAGDPAVRPFACRVAVLLLLRFANRQLFEQRGVLEAWPSQETLAREARGTIESVRRATAELDAYLITTPGRGRKVTTRYTFRPAKKGGDRVGVSGPKTPQIPPVFDPGENPTQMAEKPPRNRGTNPMKEPIQESLGLESGRSALPKVVDPPKARGRRSTTPLPPDFPSEVDLQWAAARFAQAGVSADVPLVAEQFANWHASNRVSRRDWPGAFRQWVLKEIRDAGSRPPSHRGRPGSFSAMTYAADQLRQEWETPE